MKKVFKAIVTLIVVFFAIIGVATTAFVGYTYYVAEQIVAQIEESEWANTTYWEDVLTEDIITEDIIVEGIEVKDIEVR